MAPAILPAIQSEFKLTLASGAAFLAILNLTCNGVQMLTGHLRKNNKKPFFIQAGLVLAASFTLISLLPRTGMTIVPLIILAVISGTGVAIVHPESLRGVHAVRRISPPVATAVFMAAGIIGFASGAFIGTMLVDKFNPPGLSAFLLGPIIGIPAVILLRVRLAIEPKQTNSARTYKNTPQTAKPLPFWPVMIMTSLAAISSNIIVWILPQRLTELGLALSSAGLTVTFFSLGGGLGSFLWAILAKRFGELKTSVVALFLGLPFFIAYQFILEKPAALILLFAASFCCFGIYSLMVTIARYAEGLTLGQRMAFMVGGTWGVGSVFQLVLAFLAQRFSFNLHSIVLIAPAGYALSAILGLYILRNTTPRKEPIL